MRCATSTRPCWESTDRSIIAGCSAGPGAAAGSFHRRGRPAAYAYLGGDGTEGSAVVGPAAALRGPDIAAVVAFALAELAATGVSEGGVMVPGANLAVQRLLWEAGFQFHGATALLGATRPFGRLDRYVFAGNALM